MSQEPAASPSPPVSGIRRAIRTPLQFVLRGLAISLPSVLTIVIVVWAARGVNLYIIYPATAAVKWVLAQGLDESEPTESLVKLTSGPDVEFTGQNYRVTPSLRDAFQLEASRRAAAPDSSELGQWLADQNGLYVPYGRRAVPYRHFLVVARDRYPGDMPHSSTGLYMEYAAERSFGSLFHLSVVAIILIVVLLYFLGRLVSARIGHWFVTRFESAVLGRLPVIRSVYGSVKQVTDFLFSESQVEFRRVVAVEYPRRGVWSLAFVMGEGMMDITTAVGEPCVAVLVPYSPIPLTGYTMCLPRSHVLDLNITVEEAMNFCISCGVLVPPQQRVTPELLRQHMEKRLAEFQSSATTRPAARRDGDPGSIHDSDVLRRPPVGRPAGDDEAEVER